MEDEKEKIDLNVDGLEEYDDAILIAELEKRGYEVFKWDVFNWDETPNFED